MRLVNITKGLGTETEGDLVEFWESPEDYIFGVRGERGKGGRRRTAAAATAQQRRAAAAA